MSRVGSSRRRRKKKQNLDKFVVLAMLYIFGWSVAFFVSFLATGNEPGVLEGCILTPGVVELVCTTALKNSKNKYTDPEEAEKSEEKG